MTLNDWKIVQRALIARGYNLGPAADDGSPGRLTLAALREFQRSIGLAGGGIPGPKTFSGLGIADKIKQADSPPPWYSLALTKMHLRETHPDLKKWLKSDGRTLGDPARFPWCGDFVETAIALTLPTEALPGNPYLARNWMKFGREIEPTLGAILVFWRISRAGTQGHVGFCTGRHDPATKTIEVLGGNQSNAVTRAWLAEGRLLGARWPVTAAVPASRGLIRAPRGTLSTNEA